MGLIVHRCKRNLANIEMSVGSSTAINQIGLPGWGTPPLQTELRKGTMRAETNVTACGFWNRAGRWLAEFNLQRRQWHPHLYAQGVRTCSPPLDVSGVLRDRSQQLHCGAVGCQVYENPTSQPPTRCKRHCGGYPDGRFGARHVPSPRYVDCFSTDGVTITT